MRDTMCRRCMGVVQEMREGGLIYETSVVLYTGHIYITSL